MEQSDKRYEDDCQENYSEDHLEMEQSDEHYNVDCEQNYKEMILNTAMNIMKMILNKNNNIEYNEDYITIDKKDNYVDDQEESDSND